MNMDQPSISPNSGMSYTEGGSIEHSETFSPEVVDDELYQAITELVISYKPHVIVEIGSANGLGSTQAFIEGILHAGIADQTVLHCVELVEARFNELKQNTAQTGVKIAYHNATTVPMSKYMSDTEIILTLKSLKETFPHKEQYPTSMVLGWKKSEEKYVNKTEIATLPRSADMIMIDGSAFTGPAELVLFDFPRVIILDDTIDIKNWKNYRNLMGDDRYRKTRSNKHLRNGYAIFAR